MGLGVYPKSMHIYPKHVDIINVDMSTGTWRYRDSKDVCLVKRDCTEIIKKESDGKD